MLEIQSERAPHVGHGLMFLGFAKEFSHKKPARRIVNGTPLLVIKSGEEVVAYEDFCPHRGFPLTEKKCVKGHNGELVIKCPYHGWEFGTDGNLKYRPGYPEETPMKAKLRPVELVRAGKFIFVKTDRSASSELPEWLKNLADPNYHHLYLQSKVDSRAGNVAENLLDPLHTHFVHTALQRSDSKRNPVDVTINYDSDSKSITTTYLNEPTPIGLMSRLLESDRAKGVGKYHHPGVVVIEYWSKKRIELRITALIRPIEGDKMLGTINFQIPKSVWLPFALIKPIMFLFTRVHLMQDLYVLRKQHDNVIRFKNRPFIFSTEDIVHKTIVGLYQGKEMESFERAYKVLL